MTNETNPGTVDLREARSVIWQASGLAVIRDAIHEADQGKPETWAKISPAEAAYVRDGLFMAQRLLDALASQSQPAATVQEMGWDCLVEALRRCDACDGQGSISPVINGVSRKQECLICKGSKLHPVASDYLASLTAEPAAKAGDAEPVAYRYVHYDYAGHKVSRYGTHAERVNGHDPIEVHPLYATLPSPQPDMGSGNGGLLPCPFCGGKAEHQWHSGPCWIECETCNAVGPSDAETTTEQNEAAWNRRAAPSTLPHKEEATPAPVGEQEICPDCTGAGGDNNVWTCPRCNGSGGVTEGNAVAQERADTVKWLRMCSEAARQHHAEVCHREDDDILDAIVTRMDTYAFAADQIEAGVHAATPATTTTERGRG